MLIFSLIMPLVFTVVLGVVLGRGAAGESRPAVVVMAATPADRSW